MDSFCPCLSQTLGLCEMNTSMGLGEGCSTTYLTDLIRASK